MFGRLPIHPSPVGFYFVRHLPSLIQLVSSMEPRARGSCGHWLLPSGSHRTTPTPIPRARLCPAAAPPWPVGTPASPSLSIPTSLLLRGAAEFTAVSSPVGPGPLRALLSAWSIGHACNSFYPASPSLYFLIFASWLKINSINSQRSKCVSVSFSPEYLN